MRVFNLQAEILHEIEKLIQFVRLVRVFLGFCLFFFGFRQSLLVTLVAVLLRRKNTGGRGKREGESRLIVTMTAKTTWQVSRVAIEAIKKEKR